MKSRGLYDVTFCPQDCVPHFLSMTFNEEDVPCSPFEINVSKAPSVPAVEEKKQSLIGIVDQVNAINFKAPPMANLISNITGTKSQLKKYFLIEFFRTK